jgi:hypothetical protein
MSTQPEPDLSTFDQPDDLVALHNIGCTLTPAAVYEGVERGTSAPKPC